MHTRLFYWLLLSCIYTFSARAEITLKVGTTNLKVSVEGTRAFISELYATNFPNFVDKSPKDGLWRIEFRVNPTMATSTLVLDEATANVAPLPLPAQSGLQWRNMDLGAEKRVIDLTVMMTPRVGTSLINWTIQINNRSSVGIFKVRFPTLSGLTTSPSGYAMIPSALGAYVVDASRRKDWSYRSRYPNVLANMQFMGLQDGGSLVYFGAHDPDGRAKELIVENDNGSGRLRYAIEQYASNIGAPGATYVSEYPIVMAALPGDYVDAAKLYRNFVVNESTWVREQGTVAQRKDIPEWVKRMGYWAMVNPGMTEEAVSTLEDFVSELGVPATANLYHWHHNNLDTQNPDFWPPLHWHDVPGFVERLQNAGMKVMPYTNVHLIDRYSNTFETDGREALLALNETGDYSREGKSIVNGSPVELLVACPSNRYWQTKFNELTNNLFAPREAGGLGVDGIYLDQVANVSPSLCFNNTHNHRAGGAADWGPSHDAQLANILASARLYKKSAFTLTEGSAERYRHGVFLRVNEPELYSPTNLYQLVYSGLKLSASFHYFDDEDAEAKLALNYLSGIQIGWLNPVRGQDGKYTPRTLLLADVIRARYAGSEYMSLGEMVRAPRLTTTSGASVPTKFFQWRLFGRFLPIPQLLVNGTSWRRDDQRAGTALINIDENNPQSVIVRVRRSELGLPATTNLKIEPIYPASLALNLINLSGDELVYSVTLPPFSAAFVAITPSNLTAAYGPKPLPRRSRLFDENWYLGLYPDVQAAVNDGTIYSGYQHFMQWGQYDKRDPGPGFDTKWYLERYPDVARGIDSGTLYSAFQHYTNWGASDGRKTVPLDVEVDESFYRWMYPEVASAVARGTYRSAYEHYVAQGRNKGFAARFDDSFYLFEYPDVLQGIQKGQLPSARWHYKVFGVNDKRKPYFDETVYRIIYPDVDEAIKKGYYPNAEVHYRAYRDSDKRKAPFFDPVWYGRTYLDVTRVLKHGWLRFYKDHYIWWGKSDGRRPSADY